MSLSTRHICVTELISCVADKNFSKVSLALTIPIMSDDFASIQNLEKIFVEMKQKYK